MAGNQMAPAAAYPKGMPGPQRMARKSIAVCIRLGFTRKEAALMVMGVAEYVSVYTLGTRHCPDSWADAVFQEARRIYRTS